jgi:hypothetical protein
MRRLHVALLALVGLTLVTAGCLQGADDLVADDKLSVDDADDGDEGASPQSQDDDDEDRPAPPQGSEDDGNATDSSSSSDPDSGSGDGTAGDDGSGDAEADDGTSLEPIPEDPITRNHNHTRTDLHTGSANVEQLAWRPFIEGDLGEVGFAGFTFCPSRDLMILANDGRWGGFLVVDVSDPADPELVSRYKTNSTSTQEARPVDDCSHVLVNAQHFAGTYEDTETDAEQTATNPEKGNNWGVEIVDITDPTNPQFVRFRPVERTVGTHNIHTHEIGGDIYVFYTGQPFPLPVLGTGESYTTPAGNFISIQRWSTDPAPHMEPVSEWRYLESYTRTSGDGSFPHDMIIRDDPLSDRVLMHVAHWDGGYVTVDVTDPANPQTRGSHSDPAPTPDVRSTHYAKPDPTLRDGDRITWTGPEIGASEGTPGVVRAYDASDPADPTQINTWSLPDRDAENYKPYIFSPHNFAFQGDVMALGHYHAGVWLLDVSDPRNVTTLGYYQPHGPEGDPYDGPVWRKQPNFPVPYAPNVWGAKWIEDGGEHYLYTVDRGLGLHVLQLADPLDPLLEGFEAGS